MHKETFFQIMPSFYFSSRKSFPSYQQFTLSVKQNSTMVGGTFASKWYLRYANGYPTWSDRYRFRTWSTLLKLESYYSVQLHCICTMCPKPEIQKRNGYYHKRSHFWTPFGKAKSCFRSKRFSEFQQLHKLLVLDTDTHYEIVNCLWYY